MILAVVASGFPCSSRAAFIGWVDSSSAERERVRRTIALFDEKDTGDPMGTLFVISSFAKRTGITTVLPMTI
ncbi:MAG: hypothetical protein EVA89_13875 [Sandaracinaceae bacterium]|nr:MAG: hypothetical protein EVA89_13875 [Sandaracinaceae bacterium]